MQPELKLEHAISPETKGQICNRIFGTKKGILVSRSGVWEVIRGEWEQFHLQLDSTNTVSALSCLRDTFLVQ